jgi:hypothetical protein
MAMIPPRTPATARPARPPNGMGVVEADQALAIRAV